MQTKNLLNVSGIVYDEAALVMEPALCGPEAMGCKKELFLLHFSIR